MQDVERKERKKIEMKGDKRKDKWRCKKIGEERDSRMLRREEIRDGELGTEGKEYHQQETREIR